MAGGILNVHISPTSRCDSDFAVIKSKAESNLRSYIDDGNWANKTKGRDLIKAYCGELGIKYEHFRNLLIAATKEPPTSIVEIINKIKD